MSNSTALQVMRTALQQCGYKEHPAGSNKTKFGKWYGWDGVPWCGEFVSWAGSQPSGDNPIAKSANAADIQDVTVRSKGGKYILKQTASNTKKKDALSKYKFGDSISFNFSGGSKRNHTGLIVGVKGSTIYCIEGNTSFGDRGSQSNGGCVALRARSYTTGVCVVRPKYSAHKWHTPTTPYTGNIPSGLIVYRDKGTQVKRLQKALSWANGYNLEPDGEFGGKTLAEVVIFQVAHGLTPDGEFGSKSIAKLKALIDKHKPKGTLEVIGKVEAPTTKATPKKKTKAQKIVERAKKDAWKYGTPKSKCGYPNGKRRKQYVKDLQTAYGDRKGWGKQTKAGASCDVFVGTVLRVTVDKKFPRGRDEQTPYLKKSKKWKRVSRKKKKPGDIIEQKYNNGGSHIMIYLGNNKVANAHYNGKTYGVIEKASKIIHPASKCKFYRVYRIVE